MQPEQTEQRGEGAREKNTRSCGKSEVGLGLQFFSLSGMETPVGPEQSDWV